MHASSLRSIPIFPDVIARFGGILYRIRGGGGGNFFKPWFRNFDGNVLTDNRSILLRFSIENEPLLVMCVFFCACC